MTIAKDFASKAAVAFVATAMIFTMFAPAVQAQTMSAEDLQKTIDELKARIEALTGGSSAGGSSADVCPFTWTRDLRTGAVGADVKALQQFLNDDETTRVAATGVGSAGMETETFGPMTAAAVSKFQAKYRADILTPAGLVNPTGFFGPGTRAKANALCVASTGGDEDEGDDEGSEDEDESEDAELSGEGTLETFEVEDASDTDIQEGAEDEVIAEITVEAADGDIELDRMTFEIEDKDGTANTEEDPWDVFEEISLWVDGEKVADFDASDEGNYLDEDQGEFRFSGLELVLREDEEVEILVGATVNSSVDDAGDATKAGWKIIATEVRYFDADGVAEDDATTDELPAASAEFDIVVEGDGEELNFSPSSANPDATEIIVDTDSTTDGVTILEYTIESEEGDIELNELSVKVTTGTTSNRMLDEIMIDIDGETFDAEESPTSTNTFATYTFDIDGDVVVESGEEVTVKVMVDFRAQEVSNGVNRYNNGDSIMAEVTSTEVDATDAEGATDLTANQLTGSASGETHTVIATGVMDEKLTVSSDGGGDSGVGTFTFDLELKAVEDSVYIATTSSATALNAGPFRLTLVGTTATTSYIVQSDATIEGGYYRINDGATETFTITVSVDPITGGSFYVILDDVRFKLDTPGAANRTFDFSPQSEFDTTAVSIKGS